MAPLSLSSAKPSPFALPEGRTALVVIDMQKDFLLKNGYGYLQCPSEEVFNKVSSVIEPTARAIAAARKLGLHVIHTREGHVADLSDCPPTKRMRQRTANPDRHKLIIGTDGPMGRLLVRGSDGHDIVDDVKPLQDEPILDKPGKGSFYNTDFHQMLVSRGITHLLLAGVTTECCVATTFREANDHGFETCVLTDCTGGFDDEIVHATMDLFCAYDGLLGYNSTSKPLLELAATVTTIPPSICNGSDLSISALRTAYRNGSLTPANVIDRIYEQIEKPGSAVLFSKIFDKGTAMKSLPTPTILDDFTDAPYFYGIPFTISDGFSADKSKIVAQLLKSGAVLVGITNIEKTGSGLITESIDGVTSILNADYSAGGYSYGSALAVAKGLSSFSLCLDTDGSARIPAAFNGVVGYNVTKGLLSSEGVEKFCPSIDSIAIITRKVSDGRAVFAEIRGQDLADPYSVPDRLIPIKSVDFRGPKIGGFRFSVPDDLSSLSDDYKGAFSAFIEKAKTLGGHEVANNWAAVTTATKLARPIVYAERKAFSSGIISTDPSIAKLQSSISDSASSISAVKIFKDLDLIRALKTEFYLKFEGAEGIDVVITPTAPYQPTIAQAAADPVNVDRDLSTFTGITNVFSMCSISLNVGTINDLPFGVMISAPMGMDGRMLDIAEDL
ncbi:amidase signature domain-containing protein, partial [Limtongia smithiae]|uniref:amidase signature domain-containing protein n=1 Tax=Limtongia smithiae TaxID=1125753 RepID=UPI0034CFCB97